MLFEKNDGFAHMLNWLDQFSILINNSRQYKKTFKYFNPIKGQTKPKIRNNNEYEKKIGKLIDFMTKSIKNDLNKKLTNFESTELGRAIAESTSAQAIIGKQPELRKKHRIFDANYSNMIRTERQNNVLHLPCPEFLAENCLDTKIAGNIITQIDKFQIICKKIMELKPKLRRYLTDTFNPYIRRQKTGWVVAHLMLNVKLSTLVNKVSLTRNWIDFARKVDIEKNFLKRTLTEKKYMYITQDKQITFNPWISNLVRLVKTRKLNQENIDLYAVFRAQQKIMHSSLQNEISHVRSVRRLIARYDKTLPDFENITKNHPSFHTFSSKKSKASDNIPYEIWNKMINNEYKSRNEKRIFEALIVHFLILSTLRASEAVELLNKDIHFQNKSVEIKGFIKTERTLKANFEGYKTIQYDETKIFHWPTFDEKRHNLHFIFELIMEKRNRNSKYFLAFDNKEKYTKAQVTSIIKKC